MESVVLESRINIEEESVEKNEVVICLNCGAQCTGKFCPQCGQSTATPSKLKMKNFGKGVIMSFGRLTPGFFRTAKGLILAPWNVIRDHIHGKHIRYSPPITMLIQIYLYATILYTLIDAIFGTNLIEQVNLEEGTFGYGSGDGANPLLRMMDQSVVLNSLIIGIPMCFIIYLAYIRNGARKYNFAEYLAAFIYMFCAINIFDILLGFLYLIPGFDGETSDATIIIAVILSVITLIKAFPQNKWWKHVLLLFWAGLLIILSVNLVVHGVKYIFGINIIEGI